MGDWRMTGRDETQTTRTADSITVERCPDAATWNQFVTRMDGPPFAHSGWGRACETYGHEPIYLVAREGGRILAGIALVALQSRLFGSKLVSPPFAERGSILGGQSTPDRARVALLERTAALAEDRNVDFVSLRGRELPAVGDFERNERFVTFVADVDSDPETVWDRIKPSRQRQIRQAREDPELRYEAGDSITDLRDYYELHLRSMRGHGTPPHSFAFFRTLWEDFAPDDNLHLGLIRNDDRLVNGILELELGSTVHQWGVVTDYEYRDRNGGSLLLWRSLERAAAAQHRMAYDFGRTREGSGVYMFKKSFGGSKVRYPDLHYFPDETETLPHPNKDRYELPKRVWRRLPLPVTRLVGPTIRGGISL